MRRPQPVWGSHLPQWYRSCQGRLGGAERRRCRPSRASRASSTRSAGEGFARSSTTDLGFSAVNTLHKGLPHTLDVFHSAVSDGQQHLTRPIFSILRACKGTPKSSWCLLLLRRLDLGAKKRWHKFL